MEALGTTAPSLLPSPRGRTVAQGDVRPMRGRPRAMNELKQLLAARRPLYAQADETVDTTAQPIEAIVTRLAP